MGFTNDFTYWVGRNRQPLAINGSDFQATAHAVLQHITQLISNNSQCAQVEASTDQKASNLNVYLNFSLQACALYSKAMCVVQDVLRAEIEIGL